MLRTIQFSETPDMFSDAENSRPLPLEPERVAMVSPIDFARLERKVDKVTDALNKLVLVEERQSNQGQRIGELEKLLALSDQRVTLLERKLDQWINRGMGVWAVVVILWSFAEFAIKNKLIGT